MKKKFWIGSIVIILIVAIVAANIYQSKKNKSALATGNGKTFNVQVKKIENGNISSIITANGVIDAKNSADINFPVPSKVDKIYVEVGQTVKKNDKLIDIDTNNISDTAKSPIDGVVSEINVKKGSYTNTMTPAMRIVDIKDLVVKADIKEADLPKVKVGQSVKIYGDAIDKSENITGKVLSIAPVATQQKTSTGAQTVIQAIISVDKLNSIIRPGLNISCDILTSEKKDVPLLSLDMLMEDKNGNQYVYKVDNNKIIHKQGIKLGIVSDFNAEILSGLKTGDIVIIDPQPNLTDGSKAIVTNNKK
ncbi:MAG: efflux RND transporter periplasmic adaptor subunit [Thermoanaerobacteraceae bacterium]|nr:efflux RND transporter periplasmic adaptor subunit [Thermoanaerobacteraceae bacterium]